MGYLGSGVDNSGRKTEMASDDIFKLRTIEYDALRQRMYEGAAGSEWWSAVKTELDIRNAEKMAGHLHTMSGVLEQTQSHIHHLDGSINRLLEATADMAE